MANEARITASLQILKRDTTTGLVQIQYQSQPSAFQATVTGTKGPVPGALTVAVAPGTDVDLSELTTPGLCRIMNLDLTNFVEVGIWDPEAVKFYPMLELWPGESYPIRLSRNLHQEYGTGTGATGPVTNTLRLRANTAPVVVLVEAFET